MDCGYGGGACIDRGIAEEMFSLTIPIDLDWL